MTRPTQKRDEQIALEAAAARLGWTIAAAESRERPDFRVVFADGRVVALEVEDTSHRPTAEGLPALERLEKALVGEMNEAGLKLRVALTFQDEAAVALAPVPVRRHYATLLRKLLVANPTRNDFSREELNRSGASLVFGMRVLERNVDAEAWYGHVRGGPGTRFVQQMLDRKEEKLPQYRANVPDADEFWLLLSSAPGHASLLESVVREGTFRSSFDRVFWVDAGIRQAFSVATERPTEGSRSTS